MNFLEKKSRWIVLIAIILIIPAIFFSGIMMINKSHKDKKIVSIGNSNITLFDFEKTYSSFIRKVISDTKDDIDISLVDTPKMRKSFLEELINSNVLNKTALDLKISVSDDVLCKYISSLDWGNGYNNFSKSNYISALRSAGITPREFEEDQRTYLAGRKLINFIAISPIFPEKLLDHFTRSSLQKRTVRLIDYKYKKFEDEVSVQEDDVLVWYKNNNELLEIPFNIDIDYLILDQDNISLDFDITDSDVDHFYDKNILGNNEVRSFDYIYIKKKDDRLLDIGNASNILELVVQDPNKFESFAISKVNNSQINNFYSKDHLSDNYGPEFSEIVFNLKEGEISNIIETNDGFYIVKLIKKANNISYTKDQIKDIIFKQKKNLLFVDLISKIRDSIYYDNKDLSAIATELSLKKHSLYGLTRDGGVINSDDIKNNYFKDRKILNILFNDFLYNDRNYNLVQLSSTKFVIVRINSLNEAFIPPYDLVKDSIKKVVISEKSRDLAIKKAKELLISLNNGNFPKNLSNKFSKPIECMRNKESIGIPTEVSDFVMKMSHSKLPFYDFISLDSGLYIIKLEKIDENITHDDDINKNFRKIFFDSYGKSESMAFIRYLRDNYNLRLFDNINDILNLKID
ncbi:SurA N-terminal domain-containing protein [Candidatus Kinetoplastidibacterium crithidiae]|uniref:Periplasmic chaperone PpiD n=1 Tax=Candidatus Kinetoplastidibacterium crithidiae TCC036E TaxID=1208918 RepID=M1LWF1_9PROT|nr:SurA N-terminal domain-containing protein [Candidatus Kinetoplastibacterium crithidii]AGF47559.1 peptidyl-prolyl cis-trans isomerase D [Candidatus Kinetoplastibacterium crithidii TCC036E]